MPTSDTITAGNDLDVHGGLTVSTSARISGSLSVDNGSITGTSFVADGPPIVGVTLTNGSPAQFFRLQQN